MSQALESTKALDMELCPIAKREPLTMSQRRVFNAVRILNDKNGVPPTFREIADFVGYSSENAAQEQINRLKRKGYLANTKGKKRATVIKR